MCFRLGYYLQGKSVGPKNIQSWVDHTHSGISEPTWWNKGTESLELNALETGKGKMFGIKLYFIVLSISAETKTTCFAVGAAVVFPEGQIRELLEDVIRSRGTYPQTPNWRSLWSGSQFQQKQVKNYQHHHCLCRFLPWLPFQGKQAPPNSQDKKRLERETLELKADGLAYHQMGLLCDVDLTSCLGMVH